MPLPCRSSPASSTAADSHWSLCRSLTLSHLPTLTSLGSVPRSRDAFARVILNFISNIAAADHDRDHEQEAERKMCAACSAAIAAPDDDPSSADERSDRALHERRCACDAVMRHGAMSRRLCYRRCTVAASATAAAASLSPLMTAGGKR